MKGVPKKGKYWYRIWVGECPVCGKDAGYRERVYIVDEPIPVNDADRYHHMGYSKTYCGCNP